jgi:hypothetical protein
LGHVWHNLSTLPEAENKDDEGAKGCWAYPTRIAPEVVHKLDENFN